MVLKNLKRPLHSLLSYRITTLLPDTALRYMGKFNVEFHKTIEINK